MSPLGIGRSGCACWSVGLQMLPRLWRSCPTGGCQGSLAPSRWLAHSRMHASQGGVVTSVEELENVNEKSACHSQPRDAPPGPDNGRSAAGCRARPRRRRRGRSPTREAVATTRRTSDRALRLVASSARPAGPVQARVGCASRHVVDVEVCLAVLRGAAFGAGAYRVPARGSYPVATGLAHVVESDKVTPR
jgi:hypothetical protein